jgi:hypothetical protein
MIEQTNTCVYYAHTWMMRADIEHDSKREWLRMCISSLKKNEKAKSEERNKVPLCGQSTFITLICT